MTVAAVAFLLAFIISYTLTPLVRYSATRIGFIDNPDDKRKFQTQPVALGGGIVLLVAISIVTGFLCWIIGPDVTYFVAKRDWQPLMGLCIAAAIIVTAGIVDDYKGMRGDYKLFWQVLAVAVVVGSGLQFHNFRFLGGAYELRVLGTLASVVWLLASINSLNLIDGIDGLAGSVGVVFSLTIGILALYIGWYVDAMIVFALAGALLGFLRYNYSPASIYLGDTGSMLIGLILGTIALRSTTKHALSVAFSVPLAIWAIPIFDSLAAVLRRKLTGKSIYSTDRHHFHHVLLTRGMKSGHVVLMIAGLCTLTSGSAIISVILEREWIGLATVGCVLAFLVHKRIFGHVEFVLLNSKIQGASKILSAGQLHSQVTIQGNHEWDELWNTLIESTDRFQIQNMSLNLSLPWIQEEFFATWRRSKAQKNREAVWNLNIPLTVDQKYVGRLKVSGLQPKDSDLSMIGTFVNFVETLESDLKDTVLEKSEQSGGEANAVLSQAEPVETHAN